MESQTKLNNHLGQEQVTALQPNKITLEHEKEKFITNLCEFIEPLNFEQLQLIGRPRANMKDVIKALCVMSFNGMSYRRTQSDLKWMFENEMLKSIPARTTLNDYANDEKTKFLLEKLIQISSLFFRENENIMILDSTWLATRMYTGGYKRVHDKKNVNFEKTRKLHISCLKNSRIICCAKATKGERHDCPLFEELVRVPIKNGFDIKTLIADSGYMSKNNYALCQELGMSGVFIDFRTNPNIRRGKSQLWKESVRLWKEQKDVWHETYRFRVLVEGIFSAMKRKNLNWLRSRNPNAQDVELLLKCLVYNITIIGKYS